MTDRAAIAPTIAVGAICIGGEATDGQEAVELVKCLASDAAVLDIVMPRLNGNQAVEWVCALGVATQVVML